MRKFLLFLFLFIAKISFSQVNDNFSDGNFTQNPVWTADFSTNFIVLNQQLRSNSSIANSNFYISTPNTKALNCTWEFDVSLQFATSGANYVDVYLISNMADLKSTNINGYFLRMGNTADEIALYRRSGATSTSIKIIDGRDASVNSTTNNNFKFKITRNNNAVFNLERDSTGTGSSFISEGTATDNTFSTTSSFGFLVQQSSATFHQKHFFDNVLIQDIILDTTPPTLNTLVVNSGTQLLLTFSEAVNAADAAILNRYVVNPGNTQPSSISVNGADVILNFANEFNTGTFTLTVNTIRDLAGNPITAPINRNFIYRRPYTAKLNDIVINEIFADPSPQIDLPTVEFIEIYNRTQEDISLKDFTYTDGSSTYTFLNDSLLAGKYLILCARADTAEYKPFGKVLGISPWPSLNNSGDQLLLKNQNGVVLSSVSYLDTWYRDNVKKGGGWTLERIDPFSKCVEALGWTASKAAIGGTPGKQNSVFIANYDALTLKVDSFLRQNDSTLIVIFSKSLNQSSLLASNFNLQPTSILKSITSDISQQRITLTYQKLQPSANYQLQLGNISDCSGKDLTGNKNFSFKTSGLRTDTAKLVISEIFADPSPKVGLPLSEFIEIYNAGKDTVDLKDYSISNGTSKGKFLSKRILPNEYMIVSAAADTLSYRSFGNVVALSSFPSLTNAAGKVILKSHTDRLIDSVSYLDTWYRDNVKKGGGWTLEKIDLLQFSCNSFYNWSSSKNVKGGTPGIQNSIAKSYSSANDLAIENIAILNDSTIKVSLNFYPDTARLAQLKFSTSLLGDPKRIIFDKNNWQSFTLIYAQLFKESVSYQISPHGIVNCDGLVLNKSASFTTPFVRPVNYPVVINEIFADPNPAIGLPEIEFLELKNLSDTTVSLINMIYENDKSRVVFDNGSIPPRGFVIVCAAKDTLNYQFYGKTIGLKSFPSLNNANGILILKNNKGVEFQKVAYDISWYRNKEKQNGGYSLELIDPTSLCRGKQNWIASNAQIGGTPGKENSIYLSNRTNAPLQLLSAVLKDSLTISLTFNRDLDSLKATLPNQYSINNGVGVPQSVSPLSSAFSKVEMKYNQPLSRNQTYTITVNGLTDCGGNTLNTQTRSFVYPGLINKNDILINEILFNPPIGGVDFVEVYNNSNKILDFKDLNIAAVNDKDSVISIRAVSAITLLFQPKTYWVITSNPDTVKTQYQTQNPNNFIKIGSLPSYNDNSGKVVILNKINARVDQLNYSSNMHFALLRNLNGVSLERSSFDKPTNEKGNFRSAAASVGYATPAYQNSQFLENVSSLEEISLVSETFSPDNDGFEDVLRILFNFSQADRAANVTIYNDQGRLIKKLIRNETTAAKGEWIWDGLDENNAKVKTGIYIIYIELFDLNGNVKKYKKTAVAASRFN